MKSVPEVDLPESFHLFLEVRDMFDITEDSCQKWGDCHVSYHPRPNDRLVVSTVCVLVLYNTSSSFSLY